MKGDILHTSSRFDPEPSSPDPADVRLLGGLARPFSEGAWLWWRSLPAVVLRVALPVAAALGLFVALGWEPLRRLMTPTDAPLLEVVQDLRFLVMLYGGFLALGIFATLGVGAQLSSVHLRGHADGALVEGLKGALPWLVTQLLVGCMVAVASLMLLVPGIIVGLRLFWADELALMERHGPVSAVTRSWELTRNATGRVFFLQLRSALLYLGFLVPLGMSAAAAGVVPDLTRIDSAAEAAVWVALASFSSMLVYAFFHAVEIVFFYGLRAAQEQRAPDGRIRSDGITRALSSVSAARATESSSAETHAALPLAALIALPLTLALHVALVRWAFLHGGAPVGPAMVVHLALWVAMPLFFVLAALSLRTRLLDAWSSGVRVVVAALVLLLPLSAFALRDDLGRALQRSTPSTPEETLLAFGELCRSECESEGGAALRCGSTCDCMVRKTRRLPPAQIAALWSNFESERSREYFQRTMRLCR